MLWPKHAREERMVLDEKISLKKVADKRDQRRDKRDKKLLHSQIGTNIAEMAHPADLTAKANLEMKLLEAAGVRGQGSRGRRGAAGK